jgi:EAL domain-containing protein (putative c-di-GMP-specific phosphodiesterase class I)/FixJ family two-component response regulator
LREFAFNVFERLVARDRREDAWDRLLEDRASRVSVVLVENDPSDARLVEEMVMGRSGDRFELTCLSRLSDARSHLSSHGAACVLLDLSLPDAVGLEGLEALRAEFGEIPIVIITGLDDEDTAVKALHAGAQDYLIKEEIRGDVVRRAVRYAVERKRGEDEVARLSRQNTLILNSAAEGICGLDLSGRISFANPAAARMLGWRTDDLIGRALHEVAHSPQDAFRRRDGATFPIECTSTAIIERGELLGALVTFNEITKRKRFEAQLQADVAMYEAEEVGRDSVHLYRSGVSSNPSHRTGLAWSDRVKTALEQDLLVVHRQPIVDLSGGERPRYELLIRMAGEDDELISPGAFLPAAERFGLVRDIDSWMVRRAVDLIDAERTAGGSVVLEVNVSARSIDQPDFPKAIERALEEASIDPGSLVLELTETAAIANMEQARRFATRIREMGCEFALDDFGAGFGSFYNLKHLPVDYLKNDGEFVRGQPRSQIDQRMVKAMVEIARGLDLRTIAECVETAETLELLREYGVDFAQGYHLGHPEPTAVEVVQGT